MISASNFLIIVMVYFEIPNWFTDFLQGIHVGWIIFFFRKYERTCTC